jgi:hypothetical protein
MSIVEIPVNDLLKVLPFRSFEDVRYYLNGIYVEPYDGGCLLAATNGHWLGVINSPAARADKPRILSMSKNFDKALREAASGTLSVEDEKARSVVSVGPNEHYIEAGNPFIDGKYPEWRKVIPPLEHLKPGLMGALQSKYVSQLNKAAPREDSYTGLKFWHDARDPEKAAAVARYSSCPELVVLIMPLQQFSAKSCEWPAWFSPVEQPVAA